MRRVPPDPLWPELPRTWGEAGDHETLGSQNVHAPCPITHSKKGSQWPTTARCEILTWVLDPCKCSHIAAEVVGRQEGGGIGPRRHTRVQGSDLGLAGIAGAYAMGPREVAGSA